MKIGKYFLTALLSAAVALPVIAQDKEYDVKLTIYPQEIKKEEVKKDKQARREKMSKENPRRADRKERAGERFENRYYNYGEPVKIENVQGNSDNEDQAEAPVYPGEPVRIQRHHPNDPAAPVRPRVSHEPVGGQCAGGECCGKQDEKQCGESCCGKSCDKQGGKQCCTDKNACQGQMQCCPMKMQGCPQGGCPHGMYAMGHQGHGMPFMSKVQFREMRRKQVADFYGDRFYLGTNLLAMAVWLPNINAEWRRDESFGVRLSVGGSYWSWFDDGDIAVGGFWINPEVRWYLGGCKAWYAGPMARFGYIANNDNEHRLSISVGGTFGYMQRVSRKFAVDYNVGVGFSAIGDYDGYYWDNSPSTEWRAAFTPLKVGISFVWLTCNKPYKTK